MFFKVSKHPSTFNKALIVAYCIVAVMLTVINQLNILVLGPSIAANSTHPLLQTVQLIQFAEILERMDAIFSLILFLGLGMKMAAFFIGTVTGLTRITSIKYKKLIIPAGIAIYALSFLSPRYTEYIWLGLNVSVKWISPFFQILLPVLLVTVMLLRKKKRGQASQKTGGERSSRI
ncbi:GerAB/ArcD/ProY family transporter [Paenibacillus pabuli]|uniref:GerAB/ArcD/ProY family transporter n=1 Tax=Paenibacillus pabuli TaxID=1472 RepID=UPI003CE9A203